MPMVSDSAHQKVTMLPPSSVQTNKGSPSRDHWFITLHQRVGSEQGTLFWNTSLCLSHCCQQSIRCNPIPLKPVSPFSLRLSILCPRDNVLRDSWSSQKRETWVTAISHFTPDSTDFQRRLPSQSSPSDSDLERMEETQIQNTDECSMTTAFPPAREDRTILIQSQHLPNSCDFRSLFADVDAARMLTIADRGEVIAEETSCV